jgi:septal ring factor EnvC (AmiA/AmiB activator)
MLYEPPKTKKYILIFGAVAAVLAVLAIIVIPLIYKSKTLQIPTDNVAAQEKIKQEKIQKDMHEAAKRLEGQVVPEQKIQEEIKNASEEVKKLSTPSPEDMQKASQQLNQSIK